jgi:hypothetical protein
MLINYIEYKMCVPLFNAWFFERTFAPVNDRNVTFAKGVGIHVKCLMLLSDISQKYNVTIYFLLKLSIIIQRD